MNIDASTNTPPLPREVIQHLEAYVPGEQPKDPNITKLNTNEFPYPPAPEVLEAICAEATDAVRRYPDPTSQPLRELLAAECGVSAENVFVGNGSDENLRLLVQAYLNPGDEMAILEPTYSLYPVLAKMFEGRIITHAAERDGSLPESILAASPRMFMIANPNPPIGTFYQPVELEKLAKKTASLLVVDEAYVAFAGTDCLSLARDYPNAVITRTFSKSHGMAGMRVGYVVAHKDVIKALDKIRDSYNVNRISQAAAIAAVKTCKYYQEKCAAIAATRERLRSIMIEMGYDVAPSAGNFIFARVAQPRAAVPHKDMPQANTGYALMQALREQKILVRYFNLDGLRDGVRITIGTNEETDRLIEALHNL